MGNSVFANEYTTERTLIESILFSHYIVDYGFIKTVNPDKTVNVVHAKQLKTLDGKTLKETVTENVEVLTLSGGGFSLTFDYKKGDKVLLLGLKDYIKKAEDVTSATETTAYLHYTRETIKAVPMCVFNKDAKATVVVKDGKIELNGNSKQFVTWAELNSALQDLWSSIKTHTHPVSTTGTAAAQSGTAAQSLDLETVTLDISDSKTKTIVTGG